MNHLQRQVLTGAGFLGLGGLLMAAAGSHWVEGLDTLAGYRRWQSANLVALVHAAALLALAGNATTQGARGLFILFLSGAVIFSGSLYASFFWPGLPLTRFAPVGGLTLIGAWAWLLVSALKGKP